MDEAIEFLRAFAEAEYRANRANYSEPDDEKLMQLIWAWDAMFAGDLRSGLSRPSGDPPELFASPDYVAATGRQQPRSIFAVARYQHGRTDLFRGWMGDTEHGRRGEGIRQNLYVARVEGELKVVSRYQACTSCRGAMTLPDGQRCSSCDGTGWIFRGGTEWRKLGRLLEVRKLQAPTDPLSQRTYDAIEQP
jgi:hypothetical protein